MNTQDKFLTREQAAAFLREEIGIPIEFSTLEKLCALRQGPPVAARWGRRVLYLPADLEAWARKRVRPTKDATAP